MIQIITGPPGNGKSFYAVDQLVRELLAGKVVASNVPLAEGWSWTLAGQNPLRRLSRRARARKAAELERRYFFSEDIAELTRIRLHGRKEGRGKMLLDEAPDWLNSRDFNEAGRDVLVTFFRKHRKLGWNVDLIAQDLEMLDKQVRVNYERVVQLRNFKRQFRLLGVPVIPFNLFLAVHVWHGTGPRVVLKRELRRLRWTKDLYDTNASANGLLGDDIPDAIWLPRERPPSAGERGPEAPAAPEPAAPPAPFPAGESDALAHELADFRPKVATFPTPPPQGEARGQEGRTGRAVPLSTSERASSIARVAMPPTPNAERPALTTPAAPADQRDWARDGQHPPR